MNNDRTTLEYWENRAKTKEKEVDLVYEDAIAFEESTRIGIMLLDYFRGSILDLGCGYGRLYRPNREYLGVDFSPTMIEKAKQKHPDGNFMVGTWDDDWGKFDVVIESICLSSYGGNYADFLEKLKKHIKPDGVIIALEARSVHIIAGDNVFTHNDRV